MACESVTVRVPATSGNLGAGFDVLGLALDIFNTMEVSRSDKPGFTARGEGAGELSDGLVRRAIAAVFEAASQPMPPLAICEDNSIPVGKGLGSSAAAIVAGVVAANELSGAGLSADDLLQIATRIEGHPDNVAPALLGGCRVVVRDGERAIAASVPLNIELRAVLFVPDFAMPTAETRKALPQEISRQDAVFNMGRASLFVASLASGRPELLRIATEDRLHQPARARFFPAMPDIIKAALDAGALGAFLSGGGPTVLALAQEHEDAIAEAMRQAAAKAGVGGKTRIALVSETGAEVVG